MVYFWPGNVLFLNISGVGADKRQVALTDRPNMVYTEAVILEAMRHSPMGPMAIPHTNIEDIKVRGYTIPKNTRVCNIYI